MTLVSIISPTRFTAFVILSKRQRIFQIFPHKAAEVQNGQPSKQPESIVSNKWYEKLVDSCISISTSGSRSRNWKQNHYHQLPATSHKIKTETIVKVTSGQKFPFSMEVVTEKSL